MKKVFSICLLLVVTLLMVSCSKDDEPSVAIEEQPTIVGTWDWSKTGYIDTAGNITNLTTYPHSCSTNKNNWILTATGDFTSTEYYSDCSNDYSIYQYTLSGSTLNYTNGTTFGSYDIVSLTTTSLKVKIANALGENYFEFTKRN